MLHKISTGKRQEGETALWAAFKLRCPEFMLRFAAAYVDLAG